MPCWPPLCYLPEDSLRVTYYGSGFGGAGTQVLLPETDSAVHASVSKVPDSVIMIEEWRTHDPESAGATTPHQGANVVMD
jgi:hypothetical protein